jgi:DNA-binding NtrC family response regulator/tetratricopeptide (TPR) repeat protein
VLEDVIGESAGMAAVRRQASRLLDRRSAGGRLPTVLLQGETGTGKGLLARALHRASARAAGPFVDVNCAAIPEPLLEAELFGVGRGAFTGADRARPGLFQTAHGGTLFLDEIGLAPPGIQSKLLKSLEGRAVRRLGSTAAETVDIWLIAATNEDLDRAVEAGRFRRDLYHRLAVMKLRLPPLRERGEDVIVLAEHFLARVGLDYGLPPRSFTDEARAALRAYPWPGNVRELANVIERASLLSDGARLDAGILHLDGRPAVATAPPGPLRDDRDPRPTPESVDADCLLEALRQADWNLTQAAARLGVPRNTLRHRMERLGLRRPPPARRVVSSPGIPAGPRSAAVAPAPLSAGERDRRQLAWLSAELEDDSLHALPVLAGKIQAFGGRLETMGPNRALAVFGLEPVEDAPRHAALAALAIQKAAARAQRERTRPWSIAAAIHVRECGLAPAGQGVAVDPADAEAVRRVLERIAASGPPHAVRVSAEAADFLDRRFDLVPVLGDSGAGPSVFQLTGQERLGFGRSGRTTPFVGRDGELALLGQRLESAQAGRGHVVAIAGEPGIGKSRLLFEWRQRFDAAPALFLEGRCFSYATGVAYLPIVDLVRQYCRITEADNAGTIEAKLRRALGKLGPSVEGATLPLLSLLGVPGGPEQLGVPVVSPKARTFEAVQQLLLGASRLQPLVCIVEDLHWIDAPSSELLALLVDAVPGVALLLVTTHRPEHEVPWLARSHVTKLVLSPLSMRDSAAIASGARAGAPPPAAVVDLIVARADGNPFFLEELVQAVGEDGGAGSALAVPDTVEGILVARINRLSPEDRGLLQLAAVIGRDVPLPLVRALAEAAPAIVAQGLRRLQAAEFLHERRLGPDLEYTFKHALTHDVAYESLPPERKRALHARAARVLPSTSPELVARRPEIVARHLTAAELSTEAIPLWVRAGRLALRRSASVEAIDYLRTALELVRRRPESPERDRQELELQVALGPSLVVVRGYAAADVEAIHDHARALCERLGDDPLLFPAARLIWWFHLVRGDLRTAQAAAERLLALAERAGDGPWPARAHFALGVTLCYRGRLRESRAQLERGLALRHPRRDETEDGEAVMVETLALLAWTLALQGQAAEAVRHTESAMRQAEQLRRPFSVSYVLMHAGRVHELQRDFEAAAEYARLQMTFCREHHFAYQLGVGTALLGRTLAATGRVDEGLTLIAEGITIIRSMGAALGVTPALGHLAEAHRAAGQAEAALAVVRDGLATAERNDEQFHAPELHRLHAELLAAQTATAPEAERAFERALELARQQNSTVFAGRAAAAFARCLQERGRDAHAQRILADAGGDPARG